VKLWLANKILGFMYGLLEWSIKQKMEADLHNGIIEFIPFPVERLTKESRKSMN
jgi:hypothetical protein